MTIYHIGRQSLSPKKRKRTKRMSCGNKQKFKSRKDALKRVKYMKKDLIAWGRRFNVYECPWCTKEEERKSHGNTS